MFIYLHGFASSAGSEKARELKAMLTDYRFMALTYPAHRIEQALATLRDELHRHIRQLLPGEPLVLIGSSLGGFYAKLLAREFDAINHVVMINPALTPSRTLQQVIGTNRNYSTGEEFVLTQEEVAAFQPYEALELPPTTRLTVLLDEGDEAIPYQQAYEKYRESGRVVVYPGGSHRFEHLTEAVGLIEDAHRSGVSP